MTNEAKRTLNYRSKLEADSDGRWHRPPRRWRVWYIVGALLATGLHFVLSAIYVFGPATARGLTAQELASIARVRAVLDFPVGWLGWRIAATNFAFVGILALALNAAIWGFLFYPMMLRVIRAVLSLVRDLLGDATAGLPPAPRRWLRWVTRPSLVGCYECGLWEAGVVGERCRRCGSRLLTRMQRRRYTAGRCPQCGYDVRGGRCPECGRGSRQRDRDAVAGADRV